MSSRIDTANGPRRLVLASASRYRLELLSRLRLPFEVIPHRVDERPDTTLPPHEQVARLAIEKAESLREVVADGLIVGSDQGLVYQDALLGKPGTVDGACRQLETLAGGTYDLVTALALLDVPTGRLATHVDVHRLAFAPLDPRAIRRYVELDQPLDCAGSFRIESLGVALFDAIEGGDPTAIMGLPLLGLIHLLRDLGISPLA